MGYFGLIEGDAVRVEKQYLKTLSSDDQRRAAEEASQQAETAKRLPKVLVTSLTFPYEVGPVFVEALSKQGGQAAVDGAFARPPVTSEQLLHPERYLAGTAPWPSWPRPPKERSSGTAFSGSSACS